jgi:hypothetical protein
MICMFSTTQRQGNTANVFSYGHCAVTETGGVSREVDAAYPGLGNKVGDHLA